MKLFFFLILSFNASARSFEEQAEDLAGRLKKNLVTQLSKKIASDGVVAAVPYCHVQVKPIAKEAAGADMTKFEFGRTSHKIRNEQNMAQDWMLPYLTLFQKTTIKNPLKAKVHTFADGKEAYLEPLYVGAQCLACHGQGVEGELKEKISKLYPKDQATGFKLGEFRGLIWVKEK
jgi:hypothetical protein